MPIWLQLSFFADDTVLYYSAHTGYKVVHPLNDDQDVISTEYDKLHLRLHTKKSTAVLFQIAGKARSVINDVFPPIRLGAISSASFVEIIISSGFEPGSQDFYESAKVPFGRGTKYLGVHLDSGLSFREQVQSVQKILGISSQISKRIRCNLPRISMKEIY